jgi:hypothetical protein
MSSFQNAKLRLGFGKGKIGNVICDVFNHKKGV